MRGITIVDVSPRDGLQIETHLIETRKKVLLIEKLIEAKVEQIETTSFVHPKKVPQMADAKEVMESIPLSNETKYTVLIPNMRGYERASVTKIDEVNWVTAASETFNEKNLGTTIDENFSNFEQMVMEAKKKRITVCLSIAVSFGCPFEGDVDSEKVLSLVKRAVDIGSDRIGIADTIGIANPKQVKELMIEVVKVAKGIPVAIHLHDTRGLGLANACAAYEAGVRIFEASVSGIGGCPFAPGAAGNLATEDLVYMFERMGIQTGIDFEKLLDAADYAASLSSKEPLGRIRHVERKQ